MHEREEEWLRNVLIPSILRDGKLVPNHDSDTFKVLSIDIQYLSTTEAFMLTNCFRSKIDYEHNGKAGSCSLIVKQTPPLPQEAYDAVGFDALFKNEISAYTDIIPTYLAFQRNNRHLDLDNNNDTDDYYDTNTPHKYPKYFYSELKSSEAILVLGDFNTDAWRMTKKRVNLSLEHILLAARNLGNFHGLGYALKLAHPEKFEAIKSQLKEPRYAVPPMKEWDLILRTGNKRVINNAEKNLQHIPKNFVNNLGQMIDDSFAYQKKRVEPIEDFATLCHGDYLRNNIAFKYEDPEDSEKPTDVLMFDFQTLRYSSPMMDLTTLLSLSAGKDMRPEHFNEIFDAYWAALVANVSEVDFTISKKEMLHEYIRYLPYSLCIASSFLMWLHNPDMGNPEELMNGQISEEELTARALVWGGESVDSELTALVRELYDFTVEEQVDIFEGFL